jgi:hypothetical protein
MRLVTLENLMTDYLSVEQGSISEVEVWEKVYFVRFRIGRPKFVSKIAFNNYWNDNRKFGIYNIVVKDKKSFNIKKAIANAILTRGYNVTKNNLVSIILERTMVMGNYVRYSDHKITVSELFLPSYRQLEFNSLIGVPLKKLYTMVFVV